MLNRFEKLGVVLPAIADAAPIVFLIGEDVKWWHTAPSFILKMLVFAAPIIGLTIVITLPILKHRGMNPKRSDCYLIGLTFAALGLLEPLYYWG